MHKLNYLQVASELLDDAIEEVESEGKASVSSDLYRQAIGKHAFMCISMCMQF